MFFTSATGSGTTGISRTRTFDEVEIPRVHLNLHPQIGPFHRKIQTMREYLDSTYAFTPCPPITP